MHKEMWTIDDLLDFIRTCYVLPSELETFALSQDELKKYHKTNDVKRGFLLRDYTRYSKKLRRTIQEELSEGKDYTQTGRKYLFTEIQAKRFLYTNSTINNYFLKEMAYLENDKRFQDYFAVYTSKLQDENKENYFAYFEEMADEYARGEKINYTYVPSNSSYEMSFLINGIFNYSLENVFSYFGIDGDAYHKAFEDMKKMIDTDSNPSYFNFANESADYPYNRSYGYHYYKLMRPLIYYRKDNYYLRNRPFLKK